VWLIKMIFTEERMGAAEIAVSRGQVIAPAALPPIAWWLRNVSEPRSRLVMEALKRGVLAFAAQRNDERLAKALSRRQR